MTPIFGAYNTSFKRIFMVDLPTGMEMRISPFPVTSKQCQGFISCTPAQVRDGSLPKGFNEYPAQLPHLRQLQTRIGSKCLVMYDCKQPPRLITAPDYLGNLWEEMSKLPAGLSMFCITFPPHGLMGLTILDYIYSLFL